MPAPSHQSTAAEAHSSATWSKTLPATISLDDLLVWVLSIASSSTTVSSVPAGWTTAYNGTVGSGRLVILTKKASGSEDGTTVSVVLSGTAQGLSTISRYSGPIKSATPAVIDSAAVDSSTFANTTITAPSVTAPGNSIALVVSHAYDNDIASNRVSSAVPAGWTERADAGDSASGPNYVAGNNYVGLYVIDKQMSAAGATGTAALTWQWPGSGPVDAIAVTLAFATNEAPTAATLLTPIGGAIIDRSADQVFDWDFNDPDAGDTQSAYNFRYRLVGAPTWTETGYITSTATARTVTGGTLAAGDYEWQVRTKDALGIEAVAWSSSAFFTAANAPAAPTITDPANGSTIAASADTVTWSTPDQDSYQVRRVADAAGSPNTGTVYYDSGEVVSTATRTAALTFATNNRWEHIQVRVKDGGLWSTWSSVRVNVSYTPPPVPTLALTTDEWVTVTITNPAPGAGQPAVVSNNIYRRPESGSGDGTRVATGVAPQGVWVDTHTGHLETVEYRIEAVAANGTTTLGAWTD